MFPYPSTYLLTYFRIHSPFAIHPPSVFASIRVSSIHPRVQCQSISYMYPHSPTHFRKPINTASAKLYFRGLVFYAVGPMDCRTSGLSDQWTDPSSSCVNSLLDVSKPRRSRYFFVNGRIYGANLLRFGH